jgi:putative molybdenum carrier protein
VLRKIISGGQTGADRAGLDFAIEVGLEHGGFVPRGRRAEDGRIPDRYNQTELSSVSYAVRTRRNVREGDGMLVFSLDPILTGGSSLTFEYAAKMKKPAIHIHKSATDYSDEAFNKEVSRLKHFIASNRIAVLNVGGPRESNQPGVYAFALRCSESIGRSAKGSLSEATPTFAS